MSIDKEVYELLNKEIERQQTGLELIASENFTSENVLKMLGSEFTNKYSEGLPGKRYYGGNEYIDQLEILAQKRTLQAFHLSEEKWSVNVQPYSGSVANLAIFIALLNPGDKFMGLGLASGGHLSHGHFINEKKINVSSIFYDSHPYHVEQDTGLIDYEKLKQQALEVQPKLIIAGGSAYPRDWNYEKMRQIADLVGAFLLVDMSHYSGLVASQCLNNPFEYCDVAMTTTHKSLRGPRGAVIICKKELEQKINFAVFPTLQGGPHNNNIAGIAVQMKQVCSNEFRLYAQQVVKNAQTLSQQLINFGYRLITGGTDTHLILWDLRTEGISGTHMQNLCDKVCITLNKNSIPSDDKPMNPGGVRIGVLALTTRGFNENDMIQVAHFLKECVELCKFIVLDLKIKKRKDFMDYISGNEKVEDLKNKILKLRE